MATWKKWLVAYLIVYAICASVLTYITYGPYYLPYTGYLPYMRSAHVVVKFYNGIEIPKAATVEVFEETDGFHGEGHSFIVLKMTKEDFDSVWHQAQKAGYEEIPVGRFKFYQPSAANLKRGDLDYSKYVGTHITGIYKEVNETAVRDMSTCLDPKNLRLIFWVYLK